MLLDISKHLSAMLQMVVRSDGASAWETLSPKMSFYEDSPMTRQRLNELLKQTPSIPTMEAKEPVQLS